MISFPVRKPKIRLYSVLATMNSGIESLHKILKDENRRKTILLLHENGSLSYVDLMKALRIANTGKMNYHLKVLGDLLTKNEDGQYVLSEKGRLASRLLLGFPEDNITAPFGMNLKMWQRFWIAAAALQIVTLSSVLVLYVLGYIDFVGAVRGVIAFATGIALAFIGYNAPHYKPEPGSAKEKLRMKLVYTSIGAWLTAAIAFFGGGLLLGGLARFSGKPVVAGVWSDVFLFFAFFIAPVLGGVVGYWFGKRRNFRPLGRKI